MADDDIAWRRPDPLPENAEAVLRELLHDGRLNAEQAAIMARSQLGEPSRRWLDGLLTRAAELAAGR